MHYAVETLSLIVKPHNAPVFSEMATIVTVEDDAGGPFITVAQEGVEIRLTKEEWPAIKSAIDGLMARLHLHEDVDPDEPEETPL